MHLLTHLHVLGVPAPHESAIDALAYAHLGSYAHLGLPLQLPPRGSHTIAAQQTECLVLLAWAGADWPASICGRHERPQQRSRGNCEAVFCGQSRPDAKCALHPMQGLPGALGPWCGCCPSIIPEPSTSQRY